MVRNQFKGKSCFVLGNGKSLNNYDLNRLVGGRFTMCFNRFYLADVAWHPTFYTVADEGIIQDYGEEITEYIKHIPYPMFPHTHPTKHNFRDSVSGEDIFWYRLTWGGLYLNSVNPTCGLNATVANVGIQLLYWLGFKTIYLLGIDMDYVIPEDVWHVDDRDLISTGDDPNHFDVNYFGAGHRFHVPKTTVMLEKLGELSRQLKAKGVRLVNLNPDSRFTDCEFGDYDSVTL